jgi:hypothetical protein
MCIPYSHMLNTYTSWYFQVPLAAVGFGMRCQAVPDFLSWKDRLCLFGYFPSSFAKTSSPTAHFTLSIHPPRSWRAFCFSNPNAFVNTDPPDPPPNRHHGGLRSRPAHNPQRPPTNRPPRPRPPRPPLAPLRQQPLLVARVGLRRDGAATAGASGKPRRRRRRGRRGVARGGPAREPAARRDAGADVPAGAGARHRVGPAAQREQRAADDGAHPERPRAGDGSFFSPALLPFSAKPC